MHHGIKTIEGRRDAPRLSSVLLGLMECPVQQDLSGIDCQNISTTSSFAITYQVSKQGGYNFMDFSEKLLTLRKANGLTQEQLAEKLEISRQSVSKWESGQATPELDKIVALSVIFDVTTDFLLKSSEIDDLSVKTDMLEKQQQMLLKREQQQRQIFGCVMYSLAIYLIFLAVYFIGHYYFEIWNPSVIFSEFLIATAAVIVIWVKKYGQK